ANASFQFEVDSINDHAVRPSAGNAQEVALFLRLFQRSGETQRDVFQLPVDELFGSAGNVPGKIKLLGENICGPSGEKGERDAMTVLRGSEAVDDFVERSVAAAGDHELTAFVGGLLSERGGVVRATRFDQVGFDAAGSENASCLVEHLTTAGATVASIG